MIDAAQRDKIHRHPLLYKLTDLQLDALSAILYGTPDPAAELPLPDQIWRGRSAANHRHTVKVISLDLVPATPRLSSVVYATLTGSDGKPWPHGIWREPLGEFLAGRELVKEGADSAD